MVGALEYGLLAVGLGIGALVGWLMARQALSGELLVARERIRASQEDAEGNEQRIRAEVELLAGRIAHQSTETVMRMAEERWKSEQKDAEHALDTRKMEVENLVKPLKEEMEKMIKFNNDMEKERTGAYEGIKRQLKELGEKTESLSTRTTALSTALTTSAQARGNWGEVKLSTL